MLGPLPPQTNYQVAFERGLERARGQRPEVLAALGAERTADGSYRLRVLDATFAVDLDRAAITLAGDEQPAAEAANVGLAWQILALHYLSASPPPPGPARWLSFADFQDARGYTPVYRGRVLHRLCGTVGRDRETFAAACHQLGGQPMDWADESFRFEVFPRLPLVVTWYYGDDEFPPNASFLYRDDVLTFVPLEDVIVLSEALVGRLRGKGW